MKHFLSSALAAVVAAGAPPLVQAQVEPVVQYDDFAGPTIDPARWVEAERARRIVTVGSNRWLSLAQADWGSTASDIGRSTPPSLSAPMSFPGAVTQVRATVRVESIELTNCAANPTPSMARARLIGTFFNTGNRVVNDMKGDMIAQVMLTRDGNSTDPPGVLRVRGSLGICTTFDCIPVGDDPGARFIGSVELGTASVGQNVVLQMEWDRGGKRFVFSRDGGAQTGSLPYTQSDAMAPGRPLVSMQPRTEPANCASGPRTVARIDARFDNVQVNARARP